MALCCTACFSDTSIIERINSNSTIDRCGHCGSNRVACTTPSELKNKMELFTYGLTENPDGFKFSEIISNIYCITSSKVRNPGVLLDEIFSEPGIGEKRYSFEFDLGDHTRQWEEFKIELKHRNRFFPKNSIYSSVFQPPSDGSESEVFFQLLEQLKTPIYRSETFYRARISDTELVDADMSCPPEEKVTGGRANPRGIPYLYLAENIDTCINEVRPSNSSQVYVATFHPLTDLSILDLTSPRRMCSTASFEEHQLPAVLNFLNLLESLSIDLSKPIRPENSNLEYIPTQFLCEFIKSQAEFDGLAFKSSFDSGNNYVVFDSKLLCSSHPQKFTVTRTKHEFSPSQ